MRYLTHDLPGTGGSFKSRPEDFLVEEIPAYLPAGTGEHTLLFIEKRNLTTREAVAALCQALRVREADAGVAGLKDKLARTRQWVSLPRVDPQEAAGLALDLGPPQEQRQVRVLEAGRHGNKLRTGHLRGNRFVLTVRETTDGVARARAVLLLLLRLGVPNRYGDQRFGAGGRNAEDGKRLCLGTLQVRDRLRRRFLISAYQSELFNRYFERRQAQGLLHQALLGDVLQKTDTGGMFTVGQADLLDAQRRMDQGLVVATGPMFGGRMTAPPPGTPAAALEAEVLAQEGIGGEEFKWGPLAEGTRRPLLIRLEAPGGADLAAQAAAMAAAPHTDGEDGGGGEDQTAVVLRFSLPSGAYATVVLEEVMKPQADQPGPCC